MTGWDYGVLAVYLMVIATLGVWSMRRVRGQEDYFLGKRAFGKLFQTFAVFGTETSFSDPVNTARTTFISGMSGMWGLFYWLFVTPFFWITGVWFRRMRHLTLGDWFVERYESRAMGAAYAVFGLLFFMVFSSTLFSAVARVTAPLVGTEAIQVRGHSVNIEYVLVPLIGLVVLLYGVLGGLRAAYWTNLIQGLGILLLSCLLIPLGLKRLVNDFGDDGNSMLDGFRIMHDQFPVEQSFVFGINQASKFSIYSILTVVLISLIGIVVQPQFLATGGGSAKTETAARVGLVMGNFLKSLCMIGWILTAYIGLVLFADRSDLAQDPAKTWGITARELLGPGLTGLMLSCLLAALMSSIDVHMVIGSSLVVRNIYAPYINNKANDKECVALARITGATLVLGSVLVSLSMMNVFDQLQLTWILTIPFAVPFWVGMLWRRATRTAAWLTVLYGALMFFVVPWLVPFYWPSLRFNQALTRPNDAVVSVVHRTASPSDLRKRLAAIELWHTVRQRVTDAATDVSQSLSGSTDPNVSLHRPLASPWTHLSATQLARITGQLSVLAEAKEAWEKLGNEPPAVRLGDPIEDVSTRGGVTIFWSHGVVSIDGEGRKLGDVKPEVINELHDTGQHTSEVTMRFSKDVRFQGLGHFKIALLPYHWLGVDLATKSTTALKTLELIPQILTPFFVMIGCSFLSQRHQKDTLDRYYAKMKTPVDPDPDKDRAAIERSYKNLGTLNKRKLFPKSDLEMQRPTALDILGFFLVFTTCFAIVGLAMWVAKIGS